MRRTWTSARRLPWLDLAPGSDAHADNYATLTTLDWQVHVYGEASSAVADACRKKLLPLHALPWRKTMRAVGFARDAVYLVRPDGYVGFAGTANGAADLERYLEEWKIAPRR